MRPRYVISLAGLVMALVVLAGCGQGATNGADPLWPLSALSPVPTSGEPTPSLLTSDEAVRNGILLRTGGPPPLIQWSPDGDAILFNYGHEHGGGRLGLKAINSDGSALREIADAVDFLGEWGYVQWIAYVDVTQDGRKIVFTTRNRAEPDIQPIQPQVPFFQRPLKEDPCAELRKSNTGVWYWDVYGCPGNRHLHSTQALAVANIDGTGTRSLKASYSSPVWSPDGKEIAFFLRSQEGQHLAIVDPDLSQVRFISSIDRANRSPPLWAPDGEHIAFVARHRQFAQELSLPAVYTVRRDGSSVAMVSETLSAPAWSPDGNRIALIRIHEDQWPSDNNDPIVLVTMESDGSDPRGIANVGIRWEFFESKSWIPTVSWSPEGSHILFNCDSGICVVGLDGNLVGQSPPSVEGPTAAWSPDGSRIAVCNDLRMHPSFESSPRIVPEGTPLLYTMAPDGSDVQVLVSIGEDNSLVAENS